MAKFRIEGGHPLNGIIKTAGNKNAALPIIAATALTTETCLLKNVPEIRDVHVMLNLLRNLGKTVSRIKSSVYEISGQIQNNRLPRDLAGNLRASILLIGGFLPVTKEIILPPPGGCVIGRRKMDTHFDVVKAFGGKVVLSEDDFILQASKLNPGHVLLMEASVTATGNALLLSSAIEGKSVIENAACEPHIADLCQVLVKMGAKIDGIGSNRLQIRGNTKLHGFEHSVVPDHIEAGTFAIASASLNSSLIIQDAVKSHLQMTILHLNRMNVKAEFKDDNTLSIQPSKLISRSGKIQVGVWPAFPTDLMSPMIVLATQAEGMTLCHDWMYESRMFFVDKLSIMGANIIQCDPHRVIVHGPTPLKGQELSSPDIRAGIALVIAAMIAHGTSIIDRAELIDRGYEQIDKRFSAIGAKIERIN